jgi:hypothetical protein
MVVSIFLLLAQSYAFTQALQNKTVLNISIFAKKTFTLHSTLAAQPVPPPKHL